MKHTTQAIFFIILLQPTLHKTLFYIYFLRHIDSINIDYKLLPLIT